MQKGPVSDFRQRGKGGEILDDGFSQRCRLLRDDLEGPGGEGGQMGSRQPDLLEAHVVARNTAVDPGCVVTLHEVV